MSGDGKVNGYREEASFRGLRGDTGRGHISALRGDGGASLRGLRSDTGRGVSQSIKE